MRQLHFPTSHRLHFNVMCAFLYIRSAAQICRQKAADVGRSTRICKGLLVEESPKRIWFFEETFFSSPLCFSLCLFSRILVLISGRSLLREGGVVGAVNALQTGRRRATKKATAYSKATVQLLSHAKHSNVLCKGWAGGELRVDLSQASHLKHTQTKLKPLP